MSGVMMNSHLYKLTVLSHQYVIQVPFLSVIEITALTKYNEIIITGQHTEFPKVYHSVNYNSFKTL